MELVDTLVEREQSGWQSLVDGTGRSVYRDLLAEGAVVIGPGAGVVTGDAALDRLSGATWSWFRLRALQAHPVGDEVAVLTYRVIARRDFDVEYQAMASSTYVWVDDAWRLAAHQQTPV
ncbi:MAG: DUF4440 domain-containing protein [Acidimicrobiales bacterium]